MQSQASRGGGRRRFALQFTREWDRYRPSNYASRLRMEAPEEGQMLARARAGEYMSAVRHNSIKRAIGRIDCLLL
jgi:hypothetical protein